MQNYRNITDILFVTDMIQYDENNDIKITPIPYYTNNIDIAELLR